MQRRKNVSAGILFAFLVGLVLVLNGPRADAQSGGGNQGPATVTLMVKLASSMSAADRQALMDRYGATVKSDINKLGIEVVEIPADNAATAEQNLRQEPGVLRVEESKTRRVQALPNDAQVGSQWALPQIAWDQVYGSVNPQFLTKVAILDTGVEATHTDLMGSLAAGTSIIDDSNGLTDLNGHGTWLAGIVAAQTNNLDGIAGVGYQNVQVMPVKVADANGDAQDDDVVNGVMWATDNGASVILMAFSNTGFSASLQDAIDYAWANNVVLVAAVGNDGSSTATFPAGDRGVMGVSATDQSDNLAAGSNYGGSVFLAAPGVNILGTGLNNSYVALSGTSASAAIVAGAAALMRAVDPTLPNGVVVNRLAKNADPAGTQDQTGNGRLQIARAIADTDTTSIQPAGTAPVGGGGPFVGPYHIAASPTLTITINGTGTVTATRSSGGATISSCTGSCTFSNTGTPAATCSSGSCTVTWGANYNATLTASAGGGFTFAGWSGTGGCTGTGSCSASATGNGDFAATATFTGPANKVVFGQQPTNTTAGSSITPAVTVKVEDAGGNVITTGTGSTASITVAIGTNPSSGTLSGTATVSAIAGVATFSNLSIDKTGTGYTLTASSTAPVLTGATSNAFNITVGAVSAGASTVVASPTSVPADGATTSTITVTLLDAGSNPVSGKTVTLTAGSGSSTISAASGASSASGVVTFTVKDTVVQAVTYTAKDTTDNVIVTQTAAVTFTAVTTTTNLVSGTNPSVYGGSVTFTATVSPAAGNNGTVTFKDGGTTITGCSAVALSSSQAACTTSTLSAIGSPHSITAVYNGGGAFSGSTSSPVSQVVNQKTLTVTGITASNRIYDATTTATLNTGSAALVGVLAGDVGNVTLSTAGAVGTFTPDGNVGNGKTVNVSGLTISGSASGNYTLTQPTTTANITAKALTYSGLSVPASRIYDGTTAAVVSGTAVLQATEAPGAGTTADGKPYNTDGVSLTGTATGTYNSKDVATATTVTFGGISLTGAGNGNYTLTNQTPAAATITVKTLTMSGLSVPASKVYNGNTAAVVSGSPGTLQTAETSGTGTTADGKPYSGDTVSLTGTATGTYDSKDVATATTVTFAGVSLTGAQVGDYSLTIQSPAAATITAKNLTVTGSTAAAKIYDGTNSETLGGAAALQAAEAAGTGTTADGKPYSVDSVTIGGTAAGTFADRNVGVAKPVTVTGVTITGTGSGNYTVTQQTGLTANITAKALTYTGLSAPASKVYDATTTAVVSGTAALQATEATGTGTTADGIPYSVDAVSLTGTATGTYNTKDVATANTVSFGGVSLTGAGNGNYTLTASTQAATITKKALTMSGLSVPASKIYNGTTAAVVSGSPGSLQGAEAAGGSTADGKPYSGDTVSLTGTATGTYDTKDVATASTVTFGGVSLTGAQAGDYSLTIQSPAAATITAKNLTIAGSTAGAKIYDGTTAETLGGAAALQTAEAAGTGTTADGKPYTGDVVSATGTATGAFADRNVGNNKPVTVTGVNLTGGDSGNYTVTQQAGLTANITAKALTVTGSTAAAKVYDGTTTETLGGAPVLQATEPAGTGTTSDGIPYDVDAVSAGGTATGVFADRNVGVAKPVTVSGVTIAGTGSGNYTATQQTGLTADITAKALTISGSTAAARVYNATTAETLGGTPALLSTEAAGTGTTSDGKPYSVDAVSASNTATGAFADANVGASKPVTVSGVTITGTGNGNYTPTQQTGLTANITAKALTVTGITATDKAYDATTNATLSGTATLQTAEAPGAGTGVDGKPFTSDAVSVTGTPTGTFASKNVGSGINVTISGLTLTQPASNYTLTAPTTTASITQKALTVTGLTANNKTYDTNTSATLSGTAALQAAEAPGAGSAADDIPYTGDTVSVTGTPSGTFASANAGTNINVNVTGLSLSGAQVGNYSLTALTLTATINKATATFNTPLASPAAIPYGTATVSLSPNSPMILVGGNRVGSPDTVTITVNGVSSAPIPFNGGSGTFGPINFDTHALLVGSYPITYLYSGNANVNSLTDTSTTLTVNPKTLTASIIGNPTKPYDGNTNATLTSANFSIAGLANGDSFTVTKTSGSYNTKDVATATTVTTSLGAGDFTPVGGTLASNYTLPTTASGAGHITVATVTASIIGNPTKPYDGNSNATLTSANFSLTGLASGEGFTVTQTAGTYNSANVATAATVTATLAAGNFTPTGGAAASDYSLPTSASGPGSITKVNATITVTPYSVTYDAAAHTATGTAKGVLNETLAGLDLSGTTHTNAGDYPSDPWSFTDATGNYNSTSGTVHDAIAKATATISVTPYSVTYDGAAHTATGTATGVGSVDLSADFNLTGTTHTNAGDHPSDPWTFTDATGNYNPASGTVHDAIAKATATISVTPYSVTYDGNPHTATGTAKGVLNETLAGLDLSGTTHTNAGDYPSDPWSFTDATGNYNSTSGSTHDHIDQASSTTLVTFESGPYVYRGTAFAATATATGVGGLNAAVTPVLYSGDCLNVTVSNGCTATATFTGDANHTGSSDAKSITILKANATWTTNPNSKTYGDPDPVPLTTGSGSGFLLADGVTASYSRVGGEAVAGYHITATLSATGLLSNYNITNLGSTFAIAPKLATWTTNDAGKVFGDPDPIPLTTGSGSGFLAGDGVTASYSRDAGETVGDTHITATLSSTTGALGNYTITNAGATFTISKYAFSVCDGSGHCTGGSHPNDSNIGGILTISPSVQFGGSATATVSLSPATVGGDDALTTPTTQFKVWIAPSGFPTQAVLFGTGTATKTSNVWTASITGPLDPSIMPGSYIAYVYGDDGDALTNHLVANDDGYITPVTGDFIYPTLTAPITVTKADATIHVTPYSVTYDGNAHTATATATSVGGADLSAGLHLGGTTHTNAGAYTGDAWSFSGGADYNDASGVVNDSIAKADAVISVTPYSVTYDGAAHTATGTAKGVLNETLSGLDLTHTTHTNAGTYSSDYWSFTDVSGNYNNVGNTTITDSIAKADAVINVTPYSVTYDGAAHTATGTAKGVLNETLSGLDLTHTTHTNAGTYSNDYWSFTDVSGNYNNVGNTTITDSIAKADAVINVTPYSVTYDGNPHTATGMAKGVESPTPVDLTSLLHLGATTHTNAGDYPSDAWTFDGNANYNATSGTVHDSIAKADAVIAVTPYHVTYDGNPHTATGTAKGVESPTPVDLTSLLHLGGTTHTNAGDYPADAWTFDGNSNYNATNGSAHDIIDKANAVVSMTPYHVTYDGNPHTATGTATGVESPTAVDLTSLLHLGGTTHTNGGDYPADAWTFDGNSNYKYSNGAVHDIIDRANASISVTPYHVTYDGNAHTATGTATGVETPTPADLSSLLHLGGTTHTGGGDYPADAWTFDGNTNYNPASGAVHDIIDRANANISVTAYHVTYNSNPHTATGTAMGVESPTPADLSSLLHLGGTTHTNAGDYPGDPWTFDGNTNYNLASGSVHDIIDKAVASVVVSGFSGTYNATPHGATAVITGVGTDTAAAGSTFNPGASFTNVPGGTANWSFTGGTNYTDQNGSAAITINQAVASVVVSGFSGNYDSLPHGATAVITGVDAAGAALGTTFNPGASFTNAPGGTANWSFTGGTNYTDQNGSATITIIKVDPVMSATGGTFTYDTNPHAGSGSAMGVGTDGALAPVTLSYVGTGSTTYGPTATAPTNAGTYTVTASFAGNGNYNPKSSTPAALTINKADPVMSATGGTFTYDTNPHAGSGSAMGVGTDGALAPVTLSYVGTGSTTYGPTATAPTNAGTYTVTASFAGNGNYNPKSSTPAALTINKADPVMSATGGTFTYDTNPHAGSGSATGVGSDGALAPVTLSYVGTGSTTYGPTATAPTNAGTYTVTASFAGNANYNPKSSAPAALTINKATPTATLAVSNSPQFYNALPQSATVGVSASSVPGSAANILTGGAAAQTNAATYAVKADFVPTDTANYNSLPGLPAGNFTISQANASPVVTGYNVPYNANPHTATASSTPQGSDNLTSCFTLSGTTHTNAGSYPTDPWSFGGASVPCSNYQSVTSTVADAISQANASPVVTGYNVPYNANPHTATASATPQGSDILTSCFTLNGTTHTNAGSYPTDPWSFGGASVPCSNYQSVTSTVADKINQANASPVVTGYNVPYNANPHTATASATAQGSDILTSCFTLSGTTHTNAGSYPTDPWSFGGASLPCSNYQSVTSTVADKINQVTLTVTAPTLSINWGSALPPLPPSIAGFVPTETVAVLTSLPSCSAIGAAPTPAVGTYTTICTGGTAANYTFAYVAGLLTVVDTTPPVVSNVTLSAYAVPMGSSTNITLSANVSDVTTGNSNISSAHYNVNGGPWLPMTTSPASSPNVTATASLGGALFSSTAVLNICVTGTDAGGNTSSATAQCAILAVYDASGGFVTGGGWIISPVNAAYPQYMNVTGKANFGFVSQYKKGGTVPTGNTQFQFQEGNLDFESTAFQWLVVSGSKAQFQGTGTINGTGNYGFQIFAYDGSVKGAPTSMDGFRIQIGTMTPDGTITNIVYDNAFTGQASPGSGTEPLDKTNGNGSIQIHSN